MQHYYLGDLTPNQAQQAIVLGQQIANGQKNLSTVLGNGYTANTAAALYTLYQFFYRASTQAAGNQQSTYATLFNNLQQWLLGIGIPASDLAHLRAENFLGHFSQLPLRTPHTPGAYAPPPPPRPRYRPPSPMVVHQHAAPPPPPPPPPPPIVLGPTSPPAHAIVDQGAEMLQSKALKLANGLLAGSGDAATAAMRAVNRAQQGDWMHRQLLDMTLQILKNDGAPHSLLNAVNWRVSSIHGEPQDSQARRLLSHTRMLVRSANLGDQVAVAQLRWLHDQAVQGHPMARIAHEHAVAYSADPASDPSVTMNFGADMLAPPGTGGAVMSTWTPSSLPNASATTGVIPDLTFWDQINPFGAEKRAAHKAAKRHVAAQHHARVAHQVKRARMKHQAAHRHPAFQDQGGGYASPATWNVPGVPGRTPPLKQLVDAARKGNGKALQRIEAIKTAAQRGDVRAQSQWQAIQSFASGGGGGGHVKSKQAARAAKLSHGKPLTTARVHGIAAEFGADSTNVLAGVVNPYSRLPRGMDPATRMAVQAGQIIGQAQHMQAVRFPGAPLPRGVAWELGQ